MGCCYPKVKIKLHATSYTDYKTLFVEETFDIEMSEIHIFLEEKDNIITGKIKFFN